jgi:hypothetical protein
MLYKKMFMQSQQRQSTLSWREHQLAWFAEPVTIKQDQQLIDHIHHNQIKQAMVHGDDFFSQYVNVVDQGPVDFIVWIQNQPFEFHQLVVEINNSIAANLCADGTLYLAVNKFLCSKPQHGIDLPDNYDDAILEYLTDNVDAVVEKYFLDHNSVGSMFNWVHPLTRFYFKK